MSGAGGDRDTNEVWNGGGADEELRQAFERVVYRLADSRDGSFQGVNQKQLLGLEFNGVETRLKHSEGQVVVRLTGYGYGARLRTPIFAKPSGSANRVEYRRGDLTEWYVNNPRGVEQGFTLAKRPGVSWHGEPLVIALGIAGRSRPEMTPQGDAVVLRSAKRAVLKYTGLRAWDARGRALSSKLQVVEREIRLVVDDSAAEYPLVVDPVWSQAVELTASDGAALDNFGYSVAISGNTAVVGARSKTVGSNQNQGAAYVFVRTSVAWSLQQELAPSNAAAGDNFGSSVAVRGDTVVIGAPDKAIGLNGAQGAVYVFVRSGAIWSQQQELTALDGAVDDFFGVSVAVSGDTAVVGSSAKTISSIALQGAAYVFVRNAGLWSQQQELVAADGSALAWFGSSVSVSGDTIGVGAQNKTVASNQSQGAAYVFVRNGATWSQQQELILPDGAANDRFGASVAISGDTAMVAAPTKANGSNFGQGSAYVFVRRSGAWSQQQKLTAFGGLYEGTFGFSLALNGDTAVVGATVKPAGSSVYQNEALVFVRRGTVWTQQQELTSSDAVTNDTFGYSVAVDGDTAMLGLSLRGVSSNSQQGVAYIFFRSHLYNDFAGQGQAGALLYDPTIGQSYTALSNANGTYQYVPNLFTPHFDTLISGDFDGDGVADLIVYNSQTALAYIGLSNGDGTFTFQSLFWSPGYNEVETGDINGDGKTDVALYSSSTGTLYTGISNGDGTYFYQYHLVSQGFTHIHLADFSGDGKADLLLYNSTNGLAFFGLGDGTGNFSFHVLSTNPGYTLVDTGDLNGDGKADVILYNPANGNTATGISDGMGGFTFLPLVFSPGFTSVQLADYTGDGKADVILYNKVNGLAYFGTGNGDGTFSFQSLFWSPGYDNIFLEDVNGDGKIDVVLYNSATGTEYTGMSNGIGNFAYTCQYWGIGRILAR